MLYSENPTGKKEVCDQKLPLNYIVLCNYS